MMKKYFLAVVIIMLMLSLHTNAFAATDSQPAIMLDGTKIEPAAYIDGGNVYLPLRAVGEALGYEVKWSENDRTISVVRPEKDIMIDLVNYKITANDHTYHTSDYTTIEDRTYMGTDFFSENFGLRVSRDGQNGLVQLESVQENAISIKTIKEASETDIIKITLQYPQIDGLVDQTVQDNVNSILKKIAMDAKSEGLKNLEEAQKELAPGYTGSPNKWETYFDYRVKYNQNGLLSFVFLDYQYTGGAHGLTVQSSHTFNLNTGEEYRLRDLVKSDADYVAFISDIVRNEIDVRIKEGRLPDYWITTPFEAIKEDQDCYLSNDGVVVYFQQYEYFPYAAGIQEYSVEFSTLKDMLKPEFLQLTERAVVRPVARAEMNESQRQAMEKTYQIVPELKELTVEGVHDEGEATWGVTLSDSAKEVAPGMMRTRASLSFKTSTGELVRFDIKNPEWASLEFPPAGLAKEKAAEFARQVLGDKIKDYRMSEGIGSSGGGARDDKGNELNWVSAGVRFERLVNGIPFLNSGIRVDVDVAGRVIEYYTEDFNQISGDIKYDEAELAVFPAPSLAMTEEAAEKVFAGLLEMKMNYIGCQPLQYPMHRSEEVDTRPVLMYAPLAYAPIDALTGKPLSGFQAQPQTSLVSLTGEGKQLVARTPEEAAALITAEIGIDIAGMKFIAVHEEESIESGIKVKQYHYRSEPQTGQDGMPDYSTMRYLYLRVLADTGQVVSFNLQDEAGRGDKATVSREAAQETAIQFMQRYLERGAAEMEMYAYPAQEESIPEWVDRSKLEGEAQRPEFSFTSTCMHQGIPVSDRGYSVTVNGITGRITSFYDRNRSSSVVLPDSKNVVTTEAAKAEFLQSHPLRLVYFWPEYYDQKAPQPYLVYMPDYGDSMEYIDAFTGKTVTVEME
ncbi:MAG: DUF4163 domain-containing protein [Desulfotomaculaceae bacterium]|nr:DUF4163 domain-containing protein [Desulfotomaculaceae bacterium]